MAVSSHHATSRSTEERTDPPGTDSGDREQPLAGSLRGSGRVARTRRSVGKWTVGRRRSSAAQRNAWAEPLPDATRPGEYRDLYPDVAARIRQHATERMPAPPWARLAMGLDSHLPVSRFVGGGRMERSVAGREKRQDWL